MNNASDKLLSVPFRTLLHFEEIPDGTVKPRLNDQLKCKTILGIYPLWDYNSSNAKTPTGKPLADANIVKSLYLKLKDASGTELGFMSLWVEHATAFIPLLIEDLNQTDCEITLGDTTGAFAGKYIGLQFFYTDLPLKEVQKLLS